MHANFYPQCLPTLIGSLPLHDHEEAAQLVFENTPEIPLWVQLPAYAHEGMVAQFRPGLPGLRTTNGKAFVDAAGINFESEFLQFYEDYLAVTEGRADIAESRFVLSADTAPGFFVLLERLRHLAQPPTAVKGHITGPITFGTGVKDQDGKSIFYVEQLRDAAVKLLALKAKWQVRQLAQFGRPVIIFFDEPALAGVGSSEFLSISNQDIAHCLAEVMEAVQSEGGLAGIHVCANTDWALVLTSPADIVNFDAYTYFDRFILYADQVREFLASGRILAWGIVPTLKAEEIDRETVDSLVTQWKDKARQVERLGIDAAQLFAQSLITPSCGTGALSVEHATKVLRLTKGVSQRLRGRGP
ncbi:MAG: hypothetical protein JSW39_23540 [Desulfobacterales bacterium]|nr:MAG: hypothetical protein JSW39_23540 [Desulfobacterales bacterium]